MRRLVFLSSGVRFFIVGVFAMLLVIAATTLTHAANAIEDIHSPVWRTEELADGVKTEADRIVVAPEIASKAELDALKKDKAGTNIRGVSGDFDDYLNDEVLVQMDEDIRLVDLDKNTKVVVGDADNPVGISLKRDFDNNLLE